MTSGGRRRAIRVERPAFFGLRRMLARFLIQFDTLTPITGDVLRGMLAALFSLAVAVLLGPRMIGWLGARFREPNVSDCSKIETLHRKKHATPTMGGLFLVAAIVVSLALFGDWTHGGVGIALLVALAFCGLGAVDDLIKLRRGKGISARAKLTAQIGIAVVAAILLWHQQSTLGQPLTLRVPLLGGSLALGIGFIPLAVLVMVGSSNAVNLTDGLDGLAAGCLVFAVSAMAIVLAIAGAGEMLVLCGAMIGGLLGFLRFNRHPAQVFMGDTGSLPLGALLGLLAIAARQELLLLVVGGVFVVEAVSVILQVGSYKLRRRRIFLCAPLHHHFQLRGWPETRIVTRFWVASALCAALGLAMWRMDGIEPPRRDLANQAPLDVAQDHAESNHGPSFTD